MRRYICLFLFIDILLLISSMLATCESRVPIIVSTECLAQTSTENYIATETMLDAKESSFKSVQDYNGLSDIFVFLCFLLNRNLAVRILIATFAPGSIFL